MRFHSFSPVSTLVLLLGLVAAGCSSRSKPSLTIAEIMDEGFKGRTSMASRLSENMGTEADKMRMAYLTQQLALNAPPKGDVDHWVKKTSELNRAAVALESNRPEGLALWRAASDCKQCHSIHKPD